MASQKTIQDMRVTAEVRANFNEGFFAGYKLASS